MNDESVQLTNGQRRCTAAASTNGNASWGQLRDGERLQAAFMLSPGALAQRLVIQRHSSQYGAQDTDRRCSDWKFLGRSGSHRLYERPRFGDFWSILIGLLP